VQCEETATRTRDLPVIGGKTLPLAPGPPFRMQLNGQGKLIKLVSFLGDYAHPENSMNWCGRCLLINSKGCSAS